MSLPQRNSNVIPVLDAGISYKKRYSVWLVRSLTKNLDVHIFKFQTIISRASKTSMHNRLSFSQWMFPPIFHQHPSKP